MSEQGKVVPSKLSCAAPRERYWQAWLQELSNVRCNLTSRTGNMSYCCSNVAAYTFFTKTQ